MTGYLIGIAIVVLALLLTFRPVQKRPLNYDLMENLYFLTFFDHDN